MFIRDHESTETNVHQAIQQSPEYGGTTLRFAGGVGIAALLLAGSLSLAERFGVVDFPDFNVDGGKSDPAPQGTIIYEGQEVRTATERFLLEIGSGEARVSVQAIQRWDKPGTFWNGDIQSTNGHSGVANPDNRSTPALLALETEYCVDGMLTETTTVDNATGEETKDIVFDMGRIGICEVNYLNTPANEAAFKQDDSPDDFHGRFTSFIKNSAEATVRAAPCPEEELEEYQSPTYLVYVENRLSEQTGVPTDQIVVRPPTPARVDLTTQTHLRWDLQDVANLVDPETGESHPAIDVQYGLNLDADAVEDACYMDRGSVDIETLEQYVPNPTNVENEEQASSSGRAFVQADVEAVRE